MRGLTVSEGDQPKKRQIFPLPHTLSCRLARKTFDVSDQMARHRRKRAVKKRYYQMLLYIEQQEDRRKAAKYQARTGSTSPVPPTNTAEDDAEWLASAKVSSPDSPPTVHYTPSTHHTITFFEH